MLQGRLRNRAHGPRFYATGKLGRKPEVSRVVIETQHPFTLPKTLFHQQKGKHAKPRKTLITEATLQAKANKTNARTHIYTSALFVS
jgi:hypothetical protein